MGIDSGLNSNSESYIRLDTNSSISPTPAQRPAGTQVQLDGAEGSGFFVGDVEANDFISTRSRGSGAKGVTLYVNSVTGSDIFRTGIYIPDLGDEDTTDVTPYTATYNGETGELTMVFAWSAAALTTYDLITFKEGALTFNCNSGGTPGDLASPVETDSNFGSCFQIRNVTSVGGNTTVAINVGPAKGASASVHTFVSALVGGTVVVRKTQNDLLTTNQMVTAGYSEEKPFASIARAAMESGRITIGDAGFSTEFYDRIVIKVAPGDQIVDNTASTSGDIPVNTTPTFAEYNSVTGELALTIPNPGTDLTTRDLVTFTAGALTFNCASGGTFGPLASPLATDDNFGFRFPVLSVTKGVTETVFTCNVGDAKSAAGFAHTFSSALAGGTTLIYPATIATLNDGDVPTAAQLAQLNHSRGGVILPRGISIIGEDLRKSIVRPTFTPGINGDITEDRSAIFRVTGGAYFFNFTFKDKLNSVDSHHLLDCFAFTNTGELASFYNNVRQLTGNFGTYQIANPGETVITAPQAALPTTAVDGVTGSSPYIFNCSVRSLYGLCGIFADGDQDTTGFKSMVVAQFTGVSLQKNLACWEYYNSGTWAPFPTGSNYQDLIDRDPNDVRMRPDRVSAHVRATNDAVIQEVSVFAIGHGVHHWAENGAELTVTNSNSNFGGVAALADGFKQQASLNDQDWNVNFLRVAADLTEGRSNSRAIPLGQIASATSSSITLVVDLTPGFYDASTPLILEQEGYTLRQDSYIWAANPAGKDYRTQLPASAYSSANPDQILLDSAFVTEDGDAPGSGINFPALAGLAVYIRRLSDGRTTDERRYTVLAGNTTGSRTPIRDYVIQTDISKSDITSVIPSNQLSTIAKSVKLAATANAQASVELRRNNGNSQWISSGYYRVGDTVVNNGKHYTCTVTNSDSAQPQNSTKWTDSYVHMPTTFTQEDYFDNAQPVLIFDDDTVGTIASADSATDPLGWNLASMWTNTAAKYRRIQDQYRTASDYRGLYQFLDALGGVNWTDADVHTILIPKSAANRERNPINTLDGLNTPNGSANAWSNWSIEWRRPTNIRLFGHAYEWTGYLNYSKALPKYQKELGALNRFTYYFTNSNGGRCYVSGFNEEGYIVFPNGLRDLTTGDDILVGNIGEEQPSADVTPPIVSFENVVITGDLTVQGDTTLGDACSDTISVRGTMEFGCTPIPSANDIDLGSPTSPFQNIYTGDLHLTNDRGSWTMIEENDYLSLRNNKTGQVFKINMEEV